MEEGRVGGWAAASDMVGDIGGVLRHLSSSPSNRAAIWNDEKGARAAPDGSA